MPFIPNQCPVAPWRFHNWGEAFSPANDAEWVSPAPTTKSDALNRMATLLVALNGGPIP